MHASPHLSTDADTMLVPTCCIHNCDAGDHISSIHDCDDINDYRRVDFADLPDADCQAIASSCLSRAPFPRRRCHSCDSKRCF